MASKDSIDVLIVDEVPVQTDLWEPTVKTRLSTNTLETHSEDLQLLSQIGSGGFGVIHKAFWRGTVVACKTIRTDMIVEEQQAALDDLYLEVQVLQQLRHPNIMMLLACVATYEHQVRTAGGRRSNQQRSGTTRSRVLNRRRDCCLLCFQGLFFRVVAPTPPQHASTGRSSFRVLR
jgi:hypothetical protein